MAKLNINGKVRDVEVEARHAAAVGDPRAGRPHRHQVRLRRRAVRRVLGAHQRRGRSAPARSRVGAVKATDRIVTIEGLSATSSHPVQKAWAALDVPQCGYCQSGQIMAAAALLREEPEADRRRHRRGDDQHLPLRHLSAHPRGRAHGGGSAAARSSAPSRDPTRRETVMTTNDRAAPRICRAASSSSAPPPPAAASRSASICRSASADGADATPPAAAPRSTPGSSSSPTTPA